MNLVTWSCARRRGGKLRACRFFIGQCLNSRTCGSYQDRFGGQRMSHDQWIRSADPRCVEPRGEARQSQPFQQPRTVLRFSSMETTAAWRGLWAAHMRWIVRSERPIALAMARPVQGIEGLLRDKTRRTSAMDVPLHADLLLLAQCRGRLLLQAHSAEPQTRRLSLGR